MGLKLSEAFKLLEDGEILTDGKIFIFIKNGCAMCGHSPDESTYYFSSPNVDYFKDFYKYEKPKEKVQYYQVMFKGNHNMMYCAGALYKDENEFKKHNKDREIIQLIPFGEPI